MSNQHIQSDEDKKIVDSEGDQGDAGSEQSDTETKDAPSELTPEQQAQKDHQKKVYEGEVKSHVTQVVMGDLALEEVPDYLKESVGTKIEAFKKPKSETSEAQVVDKAVEKIEFNSIVRELEESQKSNATEDYKLFRESGLNADQAQSKIRKLYDIDAPEESKRKNAIRSQQNLSAPSGYVATSEDTNEVKPTTVKEKSFVEVMRRK